MPVPCIGTHLSQLLTLLTVFGTIQHTVVSWCPWALEVNATRRRSHNKYCVGLGLG